MEETILPEIPSFEEQRLAIEEFVTEEELLKTENKEPTITERKRWADIQEKKEMMKGVREPLGFSEIQFKEQKDMLIPWLGRDVRAKLCDSDQAKNVLREWWVKDCILIAEPDIVRFTHALMHSFARGYYYCGNWRNELPFMHGPLMCCTLFSFERRPPKLSEEDQALLEKTGSAEGSAREGLEAPPAKKRGPKPKT